MRIPRGEPITNNAMLRKENGRFFVCPEYDCRANVFTKWSETEYQCNGCGKKYEVKLREDSDNG